VHPTTGWPGSCAELTVESQDQSLVAHGDGYHIIMLTGKRAALKRTYEQAKRAIRHKLTRQRKDAAMEALTERLRKEVVVEIDYDALNAIQVELPELPQGQ